MAPQLPKLNSHGIFAKQSFFGMREAKKVSTDPIMNPKIKLFTIHFKIARSDVF